MPQSLQQLSQLLTELGRISPLSWLISALAFSAVMVVGLTLRRFVLGRVLVRSQGIGSRFDALLRESLRRPWGLWTVVLGLYVATEVSDLPVKLTRITDRLLLALWIISLTWLLAN